MNHPNKMRPAPLELLANGLVAFLAAGVIALLASFLLEGLFRVKSITPTIEVVMRASPYVLITGIPLSIACLVQKQRKVGIRLLCFVIMYATSPAILTVAYLILGTVFGYDFERG